MKPMLYKISACILNFKLSEGLNLIFWVIHKIATDSFAGDIYDKDAPVLAL